MLNIIRYLKKSGGLVVLIVGLLILQAACDLALPTYTSQIVDNGISKKGISEEIPQTIRKSELDQLTKFVTEANKMQIEAAYQPNGEQVGEDPIYELTDLKKQELENLATIMKGPLMLFGMIHAQKTSADNQDTSASKEATTSKEMQEMMQTMFHPETPTDVRVELLEGMLNQYGSMKETMLDQMSAVYIQAEYQAQGIDLDGYQMEYLIVVGLKMLLVSFIAMGASILVGLFASKIAAVTAMNLRNQVFRRVVSFSNAEMDQFSTASLITRNTNDIQQVQMVLVMLLRMVLYAPIIGIGGVVKVVNTNISMMWIILAAVISIVCLVSVLFLIAMPKFKLMQTLVDRVNLVAREILTGLPVIRVFTTEKHEEKRFDEANTNLAKTQLFTNRTMTYMMPLMMLIMNVVSVLIIWFGGKGIDSGAMQVGEMMAFMTYTMQIVMAFLMLTMISIMLPRAGVSAKRIDEVIATKNSIKDKPNAKSRKKGDSVLQGVITFEQVSFKYPNADNYVLEDISFTAKPGETTAFIGSTGSGKSTLINLIPRFYDVSAGKILVDGVDIRDLKLKELRDVIGYVPQKGILFSGTIDSNIRFGKEDASKEEVEKAARIAQASDFIKEKLERYESPISQGGTNVSGGQKQRLSIARAIAKEPKIYIFDDSFSALDYKTDVTLRKALQEETKDSTVLIVAQRISTILHAEQIIVLDEGRVEGVGTHQELLRNCEVYRQIAASQLSEEEINQSLNEKEGEKHE